MLEITQLTKSYRNGSRTVHALDDVNLEIEKGDFVVIHGSSGSGKTTLLHTLGGMLRPTAGTVSFRGQSIYGMSARRRNHYRKRHLGFVFQKLFLMPYLTAYDNIRLALAAGRYSGNHRERILQLVDRFGLADRLHHRPSQMSVGEQQRIAAARAIAAEPDLILADEPTGNLDRGNTDAFAEFLTEENQQGRTIVLVTHSEHLLDLGSRCVELASGQIAP